jgi:hypothetical protein
VNVVSGTPRDIVFTRHGARRGVGWLREAFAMLWKARVPWLLLLLAYYIALGVINLVPVIGTLAVPLLKPVFAVGFLAAAWTQERGGVPHVRQLFQGFRSNLRALLVIGVVFVVGVTLSVMATALIDGGKLLDLMSNPPPADMDRKDAAARVESVLLDSRVQLGMLFAALCALPVVLAVWFAPGLIVFQDVGAGTALGASLRAAMANWRPLAVYGLVVFLFAGILPACRRWRADADDLRIGRGSARGPRLRRVAAVPHAVRRHAAHLGLRELPRYLPRRGNTGAAAREILNAA